MLLIVRKEVEIPSFFIKGDRVMQYKDLEKIYWKMTEEKSAEKGEFNNYYFHIYRTFLHGLEVTRTGKETKTPEFSNKFATVFIEQLKRISMRTLILEMQLCAECGELVGENEWEQYDYFASILLRNSEFLKEIYEEYPYLYQNILQSVICLIHNVDEMLDRFTLDRDDINQRLFSDNPCKTITRADCSGSDSHRRGRKVYILELDNGEKLVYKPRSLAVDEAYESFLQWVFLKAEMPYWWNRILNKQEYGWCQWVSREFCSSYEALRRYYKRNGILLCVSYLLGSIDIHYDNLIAHGEYPIIVDLEMVIGSRWIEKRDKLTEIEKIFQESVFHTGILPLYTWNEAGEGINVSAINGEGGQMPPIVVPVVVDSGTVNMHIEYKHPEVSEGKNLAMLNGEFIEPSEFIEDILEGFDQTYRLLMGERMAVVSMLKLFNGTTARYLVRDTQQYFMLLVMLGHPNYLVKERNLSELWNVLSDSVQNYENDKWICAQEINELLQGDIPYFYYNVSRCELYGGSKECLENFFPYPVVHAVENRLQNMCEEDIHLQKKLIRNSFLPTRKKITSYEIEESNIEADSITVARRIGDLLLEEAIWSKDRKGVSWISNTMAGFRERNYLIRPMNYHLYDGLAGMAVFFAELAAKVNLSQYHEVAAVLVDMLFQYTDETLVKEGVWKLATGAYSGEASIAFAYMRLYSIQHDEIYLIYIWKQCQITARYLADDNNYDVLGGNAGAVMVFLNAYSLTKEEQYLTWAREAGDYLLQSAASFPWGIGWINPFTDKALTGFAHGNAGVMLALARLGYKTRENKYMEAAYHAYLYEEHYYKEDWLDWADLRYPEYALEDNHEMAWCHGWGGIAMARLAIIPYVEGEFREELEKINDYIEEKTKQISYGEKMCLCHGLAGNAALFDYMGKKKLADIMRMQVKNTISCAANAGSVSNMQEGCNYGLVGGLAGIGYSCLCEPSLVIYLLMAQYG